MCLVTKRARGSRGTGFYFRTQVYQMAGAQILAKLVTDKLTAFALKHAIEELVRVANDRLPGSDEQQKQNWCSQEILSGLEKYDNKIPVIGALLDIPILENMERWAVEHMVSAAFAKVTAQVARSQEMDTIKLSAQST